MTTAEQLLNELNQPAVYDNIVVYLRLLTSYYLQKESEFFSNFIEGPGQIGDFCKREVEPMYKESDHIHITALSSVLEVTTRIVYMVRVLKLCFLLSLTDFFSLFAGSWCRW